MDLEARWFRKVRAQLRSINALESPPPAVLLLTDHLQSHRDWTIERIFRLLGMLFHQQDLFRAYLGYVSKSRSLKSNSIEYIDNILNVGLRKTLMPILEERPDTTPAGKPVPPGSPKTTLLAMLHHLDRTTIALALHSLRALFPETLRELSAYRNDRAALIREAFL